jgi:hypothetical protein
MPYLKTVLTYHLTSEAEVDQGYLQSHGIDVCLLNANTARNELGPAFYVQLQVPAEHYERAVTLLKDANPQRFGSAERVAEIERGILRGIARFTFSAVAVALVAFFVVARSIHPSPDRADLALRVALCSGIGAGILSTILANRR